MDSNTRLLSARAKSLLGVLSLLVVAQASAQSGTAPTYISGMADFQVAELDGALAPTNGRVSIESVTPNEWLTADPSTLGLRGMVIAWSGGAKATGASTLFVHGGGHSDSANNGVYIYDFAGTSRPTGWQSAVTISPVSAVVSTSTLYSDGFPTSVHTYDGMVYAKHNNHLYRFNGSIYGAGNLTRAAFKFNVATKTWTRLPDFPESGGGAVTIYDPISGNIFVGNAASANGSTTGYFFRTSTETWSSGKNFGGSGLGEVAAAWDPSRGRGVVLGGGTRNHVISLNFSTETASVAAITPGGSTAVLRQGVSVVYDPGRDSYWIFGGSENSAGWSTMYELPAAGPPWNLIARPLTGAPIDRSSGLVGNYGRFVLMDQWRAIGVVASEDSAAYVIKLPAGQSVSPMAPQSLTAN